MHARYAAVCTTAGLVSAPGFPPPAPPCAPRPFSLLLPPSVASLSGALDVGPPELSAVGIHGAKQSGLGYIAWFRVLGAQGAVQFAPQRVLLSASGGLRAHVEPVVTRFGPSQNALKMGRFGTKKRSKMGQKRVLPKLILDHSGCPNK